MTASPGNSIDSLTNDITPRKEKPSWQLSSSRYDAAMHEANLVITRLDESSEEMRVRAVGVM
jgi:hypothetical protein